MVHTMKKLKVDKLSIYVMIVGLVLSIGIIFFDFFFSQFWIFALLFDAVLVIGFIILLLIGFYRDNYFSLKTGLVFLMIIGANFLLKSEFFKSQIVLEARLDDDLSGLSLLLRKNGDFEMESSSVFYSETFSGKYKMKGNKIIFLDRPYDNDFVPDTVTVVDDKIIMKFSEDGLPVTDFASYFDIRKNELYAP